MEAKKPISIYTEMTPNPETMKFVTNAYLYPGRNIDFATEQEAEPSPMAQELFSLPFVKGVFIANNFVTITKTPNMEWSDIIPTMRDFLKQYLEAGKTVIDESKVKTEKLTYNTVAETDEEVVVKIKEILENFVKPAVEMDGGAIQFKSYKEGVVKLILQGSCSGCPSSLITLKRGIEEMMKRMLPEVREVLAEAE